jgi:hypothetical protein
VRLYWQQLVPSALRANFNNGLTGYTDSICFFFVLANSLAFRPVISSIDALIGNVWLNYAIFKQRIFTISNYQSR